MKTIAIIFISLFISFSLATQNRITVNGHTTVHLICPATVSYVLAGNHEFLIAEILSDYPNIVRIKAVGEFTDISSLTLVCEDKLYAFQVGYNDSCPLKLNLNDFDGELVPGIFGGPLPLDKIQDYIRTMIDMKIKRSIKHTQADNIKFTLVDIRVKQDLLFVRMNIKNNSNIIYRSANPTFLMRDKKPKKAANVQEYTMEPMQISQPDCIVMPNQRASVVMVFKTFTIPSHKMVEVTLQENTAGYTGRDLKLSFSNRAIVKAKEL